MLVLAAIFLGAFGAWFMARFAFAIGAIDAPNARSSHLTPTPRGGGLGILAAFLVSALSLSASWSLWVPAASLAVISFFDDRLDLSARFRLIAQCLAAFIAIFALHVTNFSLFNLLLFLPFATIFIVGTTNFFNFMDGINGIAAMTGSIAFGYLSWFAWFLNLGEVPFMLALCLAAGCIGFLPFNFPHAKVFMGDVGSVLLGFMYSLLVLQLSVSVADFLCLSGFMFLFYADTLTTLFIRWRDDENLSQAHRRHLYQILANELQVAHWKVSTGYGVVQAGVGILMIAARNLGVFPQLILWLMLSLVFVFVTWYIRGKSAKVKSFL